jgi:hypothetical protein
MASKDNGDVKPYVEQLMILAAIVAVVLGGIVTAGVNHDNAVIILGFCSTITVSLLGRLQTQAVSSRMAQTEKKIDEVHLTSAKSLDALNGKMGIVLGKVADLAQSKAEATGAPKDIVVAEAAKIALSDHEKAEAVTLAKEKEVAIAVAAKHPEVVKVLPLPEGAVVVQVNPPITQVTTTVEELDKLKAAAQEKEKGDRS